MTNQETNGLPSGKNYFRTVDKEFKIFLIFLKTFVGYTSNTADLSCGNFLAR